MHHFKSLFCFNKIFLLSGIPILLVSTRGYTLLEPFLKQHGRKPKAVPGDGNSLFSALSYQLTGTSEHQSQMRKEIVAFISSEKPVFQVLYIAKKKNKTFDDHLKEMDQDREYGTQCEIFAATTLFNLPICVAKELTGTPVWEEYLPIQMINHVPPTNIPVLKDLKWIEIVYVNGNHFDAITPIGDEKLSGPQHSDKGIHT